MTRVAPNPTKRAKSDPARWPDSLLQKQPGKHGYEERLDEADRHRVGDRKILQRPEEAEPRSYAEETQKDGVDPTVRWNDLPPPTGEHDREEEDRSARHPKEDHLHCRNPANDQMLGLNVDHRHQSHRQNHHHDSGAAGVAAASHGDVRRHLRNSGAPQSNQRALRSRNRYQVPTMGKNQGFPL